ncbi:MAG: hypothetical protein IJU36_07550 [Paludibacteraceae bacterium]|nr:hypothetical protein [Paludibacteraceae bacterium]
MKTIKIKIIVFAIGSVILFAALYGIYQNFVAEDWIDMSEPGPPIEELRTAILKHGDIYSYHQLSRYYPSEVLPFAFYMANEYNCGRACYDVYSCILSLYPHDKIVNNENCRIAMSYLQKGADLGDISSIIAMYTELSYGNNIPQDSILAFHYAYLFSNDSTSAAHLVSSLMYLRRLKKKGQSK